MVLRDEPLIYKRSSSEVVNISTLAEQYQKWYSSDMTYYDILADYAVDNHYLVSTDQAASMGVPAVELAKLAHRGKLENISRGLYRLARYVPAESDPYAVAVARVGQDAYLFGESVLALLHLAPTNPDRIWVATPRRVRLVNTPSGLKIIQRKRGDSVCLYEGIRCQTVVEAIESSLSTVMTERLDIAARTALENGYITSPEFGQLLGVLKNG